MGVKNTFQTFFDLNFSPPPSSSGLVCPGYNSVNSSQSGLMKFSQFTIVDKLFTIQHTTVFAAEVSLLF
jgi:hypothetical protein